MEYEKEEKYQPHCVQPSSQYQLQKLLIRWSKLLIHPLYICTC